MSADPAQRAAAHRPTWPRMLRGQSGYTLTELMVGLLVGLLVGAAVASAMMLTLQSSQSSLVQTVFQQDLRALLTLMESTLSEAGPGLSIRDEGRCIVFEHAKDGRSYGFAFRQGQIFARVGEGQSSAVCTGPAWQALTEPAFLRVLSLRFSLETLRCLQWQEGAARTWGPENTALPPEQACKTGLAQVPGAPITAFVQVRMEGDALSPSLPGKTDAKKELRWPIASVRHVRHPVQVRL